jgi:hypothetical protein
MISKYIISADNAPIRSSVLRAENHISCGQTSGSKIPDVLSVKFFKTPDYLAFIS